MKASKLVPFVNIHQGREHFTIVNADDPTDRTRMSKADTAVIRLIMRRDGLSVQEFAQAAARRFIAKHRGDLVATD